MRFTGIMTLLAAAAACAAGQALAAEGQAAPAQAGIQNLRIFTDGYPRAFFFRSSEGLAAAGHLDYDAWDKTFARLMGIEGKVLDEEIAGRSARNIDFFTRFKQHHPDQLVLLHYNGNARDPRYQADKFFAGHWLYYSGAKVLSDVPAQDGETDLRVADPRLFRVNMGRYQDANEDVGLCALDAQGRPDWRQAEQVQLVSADAARGTIRVRRGCYGTRPRAYAAGRAYAAAHATEGPWGAKSHLLWYYNYSTRCPRDAGGRTCGEVHADELAARFSPGGELAAFDGLEFDVLAHEHGGAGRGRGLDCDADGRPDAGIFDGVNTYGIGVVEFCRTLRRKLGDRRLILADGMTVRSQRAFGILNGIESEGWPALTDWEARDWSGGLNRHFFWASRGRPPVFNYVNHKFVTPGDVPGKPKNPDVPWGIHRLAFAAAVFTDSAVCYSFLPPKEPGEELGIWDELRMGAAARPGWLGQPLGPAVRLAMGRPDLLQGKSRPPGQELLARCSGDGVRFSLEARGLKVTAADPAARQVRFRLSDVPCDGPDLFVCVTARGEPMANYPREVARLAWVAVAPPAAQPAGNPTGQPAGPPARAETPAAGAGLRGGKKTPVAADSGPAVRFMTWLNDADFDSGFYFSAVQSRAVDIEFTVEGGEPVWISAISARAHPDAIWREFAGGAVFANPSPRPYTFDLAALAPGRTWRRLQGSPRQDPKTNDGSPVSGSLTLQPKDAMFLVKVR